MIIYNPRIVINEVYFKRDKEGLYKSSVRPRFLNLEEITNFTHGEIDLSNGTTILVEEDAEQIDAIIIAKLKEAEAYNQHQRNLERLGMETNPTVEE